MHLYVDLDGVLADFDGYYHSTFGVRLDRSLLDDDPPNMWVNIQRHGSFYRDMPVMVDARELWEGVRHLEPTILTGVPFSRVPAAEGHKREWLKEHFGADVPIICCKSRDKRLYCLPGDVIIDDWVKYKHMWERAGGTFILHTSAKQSLEELGRVWRTR